MVILEGRSRYKICHFRCRNLSIIWYYPTLQPANFGRVYAAYGGIFIVLALIWGWQIDKINPDRFDIIGASIALVGGIYNHILAEKLTMVLKRSLN